MTVGNARQPFGRLLRAVAAVVDELPQPVFVQSGTTAFEDDRCEIVPFLTMREFERRIAESSLTIMHAGAGSVIHAVQAGKVPVVMPRLASEGEHVDSHQAEFARELARVGRIVMIDQAAALPAAAREALARQATARASASPPPMVAMIASVLRGCAGGSGR